MAKKTKKVEKLTKAQAKKLSEIGIEAKNMEDARTQMIEFLAKNDIEDVDEDPFDELYDMCAVMYEDSEEEMDDMVEEEVEEEDEDESDDSDDDSDEDEDEDEEDEDEEPAPKKSKKSKKSPVKKEKPAKKDKKKADKPAKKEKKSRAKRLNPKENKDDAAKYDVLKEALSEMGEFAFNFIANGGVSVKYLGKNASKVFFSFDSPKVAADGTITGRVYLSSVKDEEVIYQLFGDEIEIKKSWSGNLLVTDFSLEDLAQAITDNSEEFEKVLQTLGKKDEKLGKNRDKMEKDLKASKKAKATAKKKAKPAKEEAEEPKKSKKSKKAAKPAKEEAPKKSKKDKKSKKKKSKK